MSKNVKSVKITKNSLIILDGVVTTKALKTFRRQMDKHFGFKVAIISGVGVTIVNPEKPSK